MQFQFEAEHFAQNARQCWQNDNFNSRVQIRICTQSGYFEWRLQFLSSINMNYCHFSSPLHWYLSSPWVNRQLILEHCLRPSVRLCCAVSVQSATEKVSAFKRSHGFYHEKLLTCKYKLICSVIKIEILRYLRFIFVPKVMKRRMKQPSAHDQTSASKLCCDCIWMESYDMSRREPILVTVDYKVCQITVSAYLQPFNAEECQQQQSQNKRRRHYNVHRSLWSTSLQNRKFSIKISCQLLTNGRLTLRYDRTLSHVLMLRTLFNRKWGNSDFRARRDDVKCENNFAYRKRCLKVRSATASKKKKRKAKQKRKMKSMNRTVRCQPTSPNVRLRKRSSERVVCSMRRAGTS